MADLSDYYITIDSDKDEDTSSDEDSVYSSSTTSSSCDQPLTVYVGKFPPFINEGQLRSHFQQFSQSITKVTIVRDKETKSSKGFAFIHFHSDEVADRAIISLNRSKLLDKYVINVRNKKEKRSRKGRGQSRQASIKVWVGNISPDTTKDDLSLHFAAFKQNMKPIRDLLQSKGSDKSSSQFAFLFFTSFESAHKAISTMNGTMLKKRKLRVQLSESKKKQLNPPQSSPADISKDPFITKDSISQTKPVVLETLSTPTVITLTNVASEIDDSELEALIEGHGTVISIQSNDIGNGTRKALITLANSEEAVKVAKELNGQTFFGKIMSVKVGTLSTKDVVQSNAPGEKTKQNLISSPPLQQEKSSTQPPFNQPLLPLPLSAPVSFGIAPASHHMHAQSNSNQIKPGLSPEASTYPLHQPLTQYPSHQGNNLTFTQPMSQQLYDLFTKSASSHITTFQQRGGTLNYHQGNVILQAKSYDELTQFRSFVLSLYMEKSLVCSPSQWNQLVVVNECGIRKMDELKSPFVSNPNLMILEKAPLNLEFVGTSDAVTSAYDYFFSALNKELTVDSVKLEALQKLYPGLHQTVSEKFQVILTYRSSSIILNGIPQNVCSARCEIEQLLSQIQVGLLPPLSDILFLSFKKRLSSLNEEVVIIDNPKGNHYVCCTTSVTLQQLLQISQSPSQREVRVMSSTVQEKLDTKYSKDIELIEHDHLVKITWEEQKAVLRGFVASDLNSAKSKLLSKVKGLSKVLRPLQCSPLINAYIHHILFKQDHSVETKIFVSSLKVKLTSQNEIVHIEGPDSSIAEEEKKVINFFASPELLYKAFSYDSDCRFISQIESACLHDLHKLHQFTYLITRHSKHCPTPERSTTPDKPVSQRRHSSSSESEKECGFTITVYSTNTNDFEQVCSVLQALNPCVEKFVIPSKSADHVQKTKGQLEKKHSVRIFVYKSDPTTVAVYGIRDYDIATCRENLEASLFVSRKININGYKAIYLEMKCSSQIEEYRKRCHRFSMPRPKQSNKLSEKCFVLVVGRPSDVESVCIDLERLLDNFSVETLTITCPQYIADAWKRRWAQVKDELEKSHNVIIRYNESGDHHVSRIDSSFITNPTSSEHVVIHFVIFGPNKDNVAGARMILEERENGQVISKLIPIRKYYPSVSNPGDLVKYLKLDHFMIWLKIEGNQLCLSAPCTATTDLEEANRVLMNYLEKMSPKSVFLEYNDDVISEVVSSNGESILEEAMAAAKNHQIIISLNYTARPGVRFTLTGCQQGLDVVKPIVEAAMEKIKASIDTCQLPVDYRKVQYFESEEFKKLYDLVKKQYCVIIGKPFGDAHETSIFPLSEEKAIQWSFQNDRLVFQPYAAGESEQLEFWYQTGNTGKLQIGKFTYAFDFNTMTQHNTQNGKTRTIKRTQGDKKPPTSCKSKVTVRGPRDGVRKTITLLQTQLDGYEDSLDTIAPQRTESSSRMDSKVAVLLGTTTHIVKDALSGMQRRLISHMEAVSGRARTPREWEPQSRTTELFNIPYGSVERSLVIGKFTTTMPNVNIVSVQRVQNQYLWEKFIHHKGMIEQKNDGQANEKELFHGTRGNNPRQIYDSEEGFDMRFSASGMWGQANYFAVNASYSNNYAYTLANGQRQVFLARVLTGASYYCLPNNALRMPPKIPSYTTSASTSVQLSELRYDTVNGTTGGSIVYMTYDNLKAYPAYLITYENRPG